MALCPSNCEQHMTTALGSWEHPAAVAQQSAISGSEARHLALYHSSVPFAPKNERWSICCMLTNYTSGLPAQLCAQKQHGHMKQHREEALSRKEKKRLHPLASV